MSKSAIYKEDGHLADKELAAQLDAAVTELKEKMKATVPISRGGHRVGYGLSKAKKGIAADTVISIVRAIKGLPGW